MSLQNSATNTYEYVNNNFCKVHVETKYLE